MVLLLRRCLLSETPCSSFKEGRGCHTVMVENVHYLSRDKRGKYSPVLLASCTGNVMHVNIDIYLSVNKYLRKCQHQLAMGTPRISTWGGLFFLRIF